MANPEHVAIVKQGSVINKLHSPLMRAIRLLLFRTAEVKQAP